MNSMIGRRVADTAERVVEWLVKRNYERIEAYSGGVRLSASHLAKAVADYGRKLTMPPASAFQELDVIEVRGSSPKAWSVRCDLWTEEEGRSDLTLEMTLIEQDGELLAVEVDNLHVL